MKTESREKLPLILYELKTNLLNFNEQEEQRTDEQGHTYTMYVYDSFRVNKSMFFDDIVVTMIRDRYNENDEAKFARWNLEVNILKTKTLTSEDIAELTDYSNYVAWCHEAAKQVI